MSADLFDKAAQAVKNFRKDWGSMSNDQALGLYGLFK
jgi:hypothetical protein